jgi:hypothetical protein
MGCMYVHLTLGPERNHLAPDGQNVLGVILFNNVSRNLLMSLLCQKKIQGLPCVSAFNKQKISTSRSQLNL